MSNVNAIISNLVQDITYTPFNSVLSIKENNKELQFTYAADQQRRKMQYFNNNILEKTTYYFGNYEKITLANGNQTELHYIAGGDGLAAIHVITPNSQPSSPTTFYTYTDHLGSITTLTDANATIVYEQNFDAWGRERNPNTWEYTNATAMGSVTGFEWLTRGYTGHEHLSPFGGAGGGSLINMNGRLYDPILSRMLSPDNFVQDATSTQGYNRYSYVINNPLKYTDPSGESFDDFLRDVVDLFTIPARLPSTITDYIETGNWDSDYLSGKQAPIKYRNLGGGVQSMGDYSGSLNSDFLGSKGGATDASRERIDMNAMNKEAWDNRSDRRDKAFLESIGNNQKNKKSGTVKQDNKEPNSVKTNSFSDVNEDSEIQFSNNSVHDKVEILDKNGRVIYKVVSKDKKNNKEYAGFEGTYFRYGRTIKMKDVFEKNDQSYSEIKIRVTGNPTKETLWIYYYSGMKDVTPPRRTNIPQF